MMARVARQVRATGHVQGVFFRAWTREQAERLDISGWIRNCADGSIEAHLEGPDESVDQLLDLLRRGPSGARVDNLEVKESAPEYGDWFAVRH
jgi:acylphosphatase